MSVIFPVSPIDAVQDTGKLLLKQGAKQGLEGGLEHAASNHVIRKTVAGGTPGSVGTGATAGLVEELVAEVAYRRQKLSYHDLPNKTPGHWEAILDESDAMANSGKYKTVYANKGLAREFPISKSTGGPMHGEFVTKE